MKQRISIQTNGDRVEVVAVSPEMTRARLSEQAPGESEDRFRLIIENSSDLIAELTPDGQLLYANAAFKTALNQDTATLLNRRVLDWIHVDDLSLAKRLLNKANQTATFRFRDGQGNWVWLEGAARRYRESSGEERVVLICRDVTRRVESEQARAVMEVRLQQSQKMEALGTLAGGIAHDFNNILAAVIGNIELARLTMPADNPAAHHLGEIMRASSRATDLVRQILTFSRQKEHERGAIQITPIVFEVTKLLRAALPSSVEIHTIVPAGLPNILGDAGQVHQILMNLGTNAGHAMRKEGGVLEIALSRVAIADASERSAAGLHPGTYVRLIVRDTGEGMTPEVIGRIFEPFFTTKPMGQGTGLGLAVVHGIIKAHDGAISVASDVGKGSSFEVYLPAVEEGMTAGSNQTRELPKGNGEGVLYVDDEPALCRLVEHSLSRCGYRGVAQSDPVEALRLFVENPGRFAVVITDFTMPKMGGLDLLAQIKEMSPLTPVVLTTGFTGNLDVPALNAAGVDEVLPKPFTMQRLAECLERVVRAR